MPSIRALSISVARATELLAGAPGVELSDIALSADFRIVSDEAVAPRSPVMLPGSDFTLLWGGDETLIVVSTDLSHYHDQVTATGLDLDESGHTQLDRLATGCRAAANRAEIAVDGQRFRPQEPDSPVNRIEGRFQRLETDPLPCTKSVLQSHSAEAATANNFCS